VIDTLLVALEDSEVVISALADADTHVAALAVTGKGYHRHPAPGERRAFHR